MRQFIYILVAAGTAYMAKLSVPQPFTWFFVLGIGLLGIGLAFVPVAERGLDEWIVNFVKAINSPTERLWKKEVMLPQAFAYEQNINMMHQELITLAPTASRRKLEEFLQGQGKSSKVDSLDIPEQEYIDKIKEAYKNRPAEEPVPELDTVLQKTPAEEPTLLQKNASQAQQPVDMSKEGLRASSRRASQAPRLMQQDKMSQIIRSRMSKSEIKLPKEGDFGLEPKLRPLGQHAGRRFVNLTPAQGQIVLPIRGEKIIELTARADENYELKTRKLQEMLGRNQPSGPSGDEHVEPKLHYKALPSSINRPNIIMGVIMNGKGEHLENVVLAIKNQKGEPIRAIKTDKLGRFLITTPLPRGEYTIEMDETNETNLSFDIIPLSVRGDPLPSLEIIGY